jgi:hypothetical protein
MGIGLGKHGIGRANISIRRRCGCGWVGESNLRHVPLRGWEIEVEIAKETKNEGQPHLRRILIAVTLIKGSASETKVVGSGMASLMSAVGHLVIWPESRMLSKMVRIWLA